MTGLTKVENFLTTQELNALVAFAREVFEENPRREGNIVCSRFGFGIKTTYKGNDAYLDGFMAADTLPPLIDAVATKLNLPEKPDTVYLLRYEPGQRMFPHVDGTNAGPIVSMVSIYGSAQLLFRRGGEQDVIVDTKAGDLIQIQDEARNNWAHGVLPVEEERISLIFRKFTPVI